jgi:hypothetical protein
MVDFRAGISIRVRGQTAMDWRELKSENYDDLDEFAEAVKRVIQDNVLDYLEGEDETDEP